MRWLCGAICGVLALSACGPRAANPYPDVAKARFERACPRQSEVCTCTWDRITRTLTYEEYEAALANFRETGLMDQRVTLARTYCLDHRQS